MNKLIYLVVMLFVIQVGLAHSFENTAEQSKILAIEEAQLLFQQAVMPASVPGISVAVANSSGLLWAQGFGFSDLENQVLMNRHTKLRIGSVAKVITTAALMRLFQQGKIDFTSDVRKWVSEWPKKHSAINLKQLSSHTSGIRHYYHGDKVNEFLANVEYKNSIDALSIFKNDALKFSPGSQFSYSTYAWTLISAVMEKVENKHFKTIIEQQVLTPLKLTDTTFDDQAILIDHRQRPYSFSHGRLINSPQVNASYKYAGGGFLATPSDVVTFAMAHTQAGYLSTKSLTMMFSKSQLTNGKEISFGIGWDIGFERRIAKAKVRPQQNKALIDIMNSHPNSVMHSGGSMGGTTMMILCLEHQHAVTVVKNVDSEPTANVFALAVKALDIFYQKS